MTYDEWVKRNPVAAVELAEVLAPEPWEGESDCENSETWAQQQARFDIAHQGAMSWRNNVGATPAKEIHSCPACKHKWETIQQPTRFVLANDSAKMDKKIKSSDLILAIPRVITKDMVGTTIAQFGAVEVKKPGWVQSYGDGDKAKHEAAQAKWLQLIAQIGGYSAFSTGKVKL